MPKSSKPIFYQLFYYRCYPHSLSNGVIPNPIMSSLTTHPAQHPYLCYTYLILVLTLNRPTLRTKTVSLDDKIFQNERQQEYHLGKSMQTG